MSVYSLIKYNRIIQKSFKLQFSKVKISNRDKVLGLRMQPKSLERSPAVGDFYGTRIEIWAGFGPVRQLLRPVFSCFHEQKKNFLKTF